MNKEKFKKEIHEIVSKSKYALDPDIILKKIKCKDTDLFLEIIKELRVEGRVILTKKGKIAASSALGFFLGKIISMSRGFSFARLVDSGSDILIRNEKLRGAIVGDTVLLYNLRKSEKGVSASVQRITDKGSRTLTGYVERNNVGYELVPDGPYRISIPIHKAATMGAKEGDKVQVILSPITKRNSLSANVIKIYGKACSAKICSDAIIDAYKIPSTFQAEVSVNAKKISEKEITKEEFKNRLDLRNEHIFTIDGEDAKDLDDAVSVKKTQSGWKLAVHIADVSHYVKENLLIDKEAKTRGTSVYFADRVIPMLPKELSNGVCSLNANEDKLTFSSLIELDEEGNILSYEFKKTVINSKVRGVYSEINSILDNTAKDEIKEKYNKISQSIKDAYELYNILKKQSQKRGNMDLDSSEPKFELDANGVCIGVSRRTSGKAEEMIEQFMITANRSAAIYAKNKSIPFIYRVHEEPNPEKLKDLSNLISVLGFSNKDIAPGMRASDFAKVLAGAKDSDYSKIISHQILRSMAKAKYSNTPLGHFGLSLEDYCHFTSPIRRYPDLAIHRILSDLVGGESKEKIKKKYEDFVVESSKQSSICEVRAMNAQRDTEKCYMAEYMNKHIGEIYDGIISGATARGMFVELQNSVEGFVALNLFKDAEFTFEWPVRFIDKKSDKRLQIGDKIKIKVIASSVENSFIDFEPIEY